MRGGVCFVNLTASNSKHNNTFLNNNNKNNKKCLILAAEATTNSTTNQNNKFSCLCISHSMRNRDRYIRKPETKWKRNIESSDHHNHNKILYPGCRLHTTFPSEVVKMMSLSVVCRASSYFCCLVCAKFRLTATNPTQPDQKLNINKIESSMISSPSSCFAEQTWRQDRNFFIPSSEVCNI